MRPNVLALTIENKDYTFKKIKTPSQLSFHLSRKNVFNRPIEYDLNAKYRKIAGVIKFTTYDGLFNTSCYQSIAEVMEADSLDKLSLYYISKSKKNKKE